MLAQHKGDFALAEFDPARHLPSAVREILALAVWSPTPEKLDAIFLDYATHGNHTLFVITGADLIIGLIGLDTGERPSGTVTHLAVHPDFRRRGIGRRLILEAARLTGLHTMIAETDIEAVAFYRQYGFDMAETVSPWPGARRYRGTKDMV